MLGIGIETVEFEEFDLKTPVPACVGCVAAMLMLGYRLVGGGAVNHEDVLVGCDRLQNFRWAPRARLRRLVRFHFRHGGIPGVQVLGDAHRIGAAEFVLRWRQDGALRRTLSADPRYDRWYGRLHQLLAASRKTLLAIDENRFCYGARRGNAATLRDFSRMMDNGF